MLVADA